VLGLLVFRPIVYKPLWDTFVFRFEFYEKVSFLSSHKVLLRTTNPYLWIFDSKWRIFLTYLGTSSKWRDFIPFRKNPQIDVLHFPPFRFRVHTHFRSRRISSQIRDDPSSSGNQSSVGFSSLRILFSLGLFFVFFCVWCSRSSFSCTLPYWLHSDIDRLVSLLQDSLRFVFLVPKWVV